MTAVLKNQLDKWLAKGPHQGIQNPGQENFVLGSGKGSRQENQDRLVFFRCTPLQGSGTWSGGILCDGIGGQKDGGKCAELATSSLLSYLVSPSKDTLAVHLEKGIQFANNVVFEHYHGEGGTTLCAFLYYNGEMVVGNVGDSRVYLVRQTGKVLGLKQISVDDTLHGVLSAMNESASAAPEPEHRGLIQFIGMGRDMKVHLDRPDLRGINSIMMTSDGVHHLETSLMQKIISRAPDPKALMDRLIRTAIWAGDDNATALMFRLPQDKQDQNIPDPGWLQLWQPTEQILMPLNTGQQAEQLSFFRMVAGDSDRQAPRRRGQKGSRVVYFEKPEVKTDPERQAKEEVVNQ